jgi:hypothetical protein
VSLLPEDLLMPDDFSVKWEYCLVDNRYDSDSGLSKRFNALGAEGWELTAVHNSIFFFKRPIFHQ